MWVVPSVRVVGVRSGQGLRGLETDGVWIVTACVLLWAGCCGSRNRKADVWIMKLIILIDDSV